MPSELKLSSSHEQKASVKPVKTTQEKVKDAMISGAVETAFLHSLDTTRRRIQKHKGLLYDNKLSFFDNKNNIKQVLFQHTIDQPIRYKIRSLYQGFVPAFLYNLGKRPIKFGLQDDIQNFYFQHVVSYRVLANALAGSTAGLLEAVTFNSVDAYKIEKQTVDSSKGKNFFQLLYDENLWKKGLAGTMLRNGIGSFPLFGVPEAIRWSLDLQKENTTLWQSIAINYCGSASSILAVAPLDVPKTRQQAGEGAGDFRTFIKIMSTTAKEEGVKALFKGAALGCATAGVKQTAFMVLFDNMHKFFKKPGDVKANNNTQLALDDKSILSKR
jgi:hypothetical protein